MRIWPVLARLGLFAAAAALLLDLVAHANDLTLRRRLMRGLVNSPESLERGSQISDAANYALAGALALCAVTFLAWFYICYRNLNERGAANLSDHWALTGWVVPVLNLWRPPSIMAELTSQLRSSNADDNRQVSQGPGSSVVWPWWMLLGLGVAAQVLLRFVSNLLSKPETSMEAWLYWQIAALLGDIVLLGAVACALVLVARVERQQRWFSSSSLV